MVKHLVGLATCFARTLDPPYKDRRYKGLPMAVSLWMPWRWTAELRRHGVLGINARNCEYVLPGNPRPFYPRVDDKQFTKQLVPRAEYPRAGDLRRHRAPRRHSQFPGDDPTAAGVRHQAGPGSEGRGIMVIAGHDGQQFRHSSGEHWQFDDLTYHLADHPRRALFAGRPARRGDHRAADRAAPGVREAGRGGHARLRIMLYRCVPVMAMVRLPTRPRAAGPTCTKGPWRAGIHLAGGRTLGGVCQDRAVSVHPDTGPRSPACRSRLERLGGRVDKLAEALELDYLGVDFVLDAAAGPVVLEANARPGLSIQVANRRGLLPRLAFLNAQPAERFALAERKSLIAEVAGV